MRSRLVDLAVASTVLCLVTACGGSDEVEVNAPSVEDEACFAAFPLGGGMTPSLADADLLPADFPEAPVDATLCAITGNAEVGVNLGYLSQAAPEEVVAGYLEAFAPYDAVSERRRHGVAAEAGDVTILVVPGSGKYEIHLQAL